MRLADLEKAANKKMRELARLYARVPRGKRRQAYKIYLDLGEGRLSYEEALRKLRELARG